MDEKPMMNCWFDAASLDSVDCRDCVKNEVCRIYAELEEARDLLTSVEYYYGVTSELMRQIRGFLKGGDWWTKTQKK